MEPSAKRSIYLHKANLVLVRLLALSALRSLPHDYVKSTTKVIASFTVHTILYHPAMAHDYFQTWFFAIQATVHLEQDKEMLCM